LSAGEKLPAKESTLDHLLSRRWHIMVVTFVRAMLHWIISWSGCVKHVGSLFVSSGSNVTLN
jgi:hypothetical protein